MAEIAVSLGGFLAVNAGFSLVSDLTAQWIEGRKLSAVDDELGVDWDRAVAFTASGVAFSGMTQFVRHYAIDEMFPKGGELWIAVGKTITNQVIFAPVLRAASMGAVQYFRTKSWDDVKEKLAADFFEAQGVSYLVKPLSNLVAFTVFPNSLVGQAVVLRVAGFGYNIYYSYMLNRAVAHSKETTPEPTKLPAPPATACPSSGSEQKAEGECTVPKRRTRRLRLIRRQVAVDVEPPPPPRSTAPKRVVEGVDGIIDLRNFLRDRAVVQESSRRHRRQEKKVTAGVAQMRNAFFNLADISPYSAMYGPAT